MSYAADAPAHRDRLATEIKLPRRTLWLLRLFRWYARRYVRKHFHAIRLSQSGQHYPPPNDEPLLIVLNHPAWWDPMICLVLSGLMAHRDQFAAIDAEAVKRYAFFKKLGFVPVDARTLRGAVEFVTTGTTILSEPNRAFWVTAQGRFADVRERPLVINSGVGHIAARLKRGTILPLSLEYTFWTERTPEALVRVGEPIRIQNQSGLSGKEWTSLIEAEMTRNLDALNAEAVTRDPSKFVLLLAGKTGVGGPYDWWCRLKSWFRAEKFDPSHKREEERA